MVSGRNCVGFIGAGMISQIAYLPFFLKDKNIYVKTISDDRFSAKNYLATYFKTTNVVDDFNEVLNDKDIETVIIITPRKANAKLAFEALSQGKNVIIEKPLGYSKKQIAKLLEMAKKHDTRLHVCHMKRYDVGIQKTKQLLHSYLKNKKFGELITSNFYNYSTNYAYKIPKHQKKSESRLIRFPVWKSHPDWLREKYHSRYDWFLNVAIHNINLLNFFFNNDLLFNKALMINSQNVKSDFIFKKNIPVTFDLVKSDIGKWTEGGQFIFEKGRISFEIPSPMNKRTTTKIKIDEHSSNCAIKYNLRGGWCFKEQSLDLISSIVNKKKTLCMGEDSFADLELVEKLWKHINKG